MILDQLKNAHLYFALGKNFETGFQYLLNTNFENAEPGKYEIDGENVYAIIQEYNSKPLTAGKWEAHKKYADIQMIIDGKEKMGFSNSQKMIVTQEYHEEKDIMFLKGEGNFIQVEAGSFALFFPTDIHMPGIAVNLSTPIKKVVIKVKVQD